MKTLSTKMFAIATVTVFGLATSAMAGNKGGFGGLGIRVGNNGGGLSFNSGNQNKKHNNNNNNFNKKNNGGSSCSSGGHGGGYGGGYPNGGYPTGGYPTNQNYGQAYEPFHNMYICQPGDSFYTVSLKEYGTSSVANQIASFNRMQPSAALVPGQRLMLPSVSPNGTLTQSRAPSPFVDSTPSVPTANYSQPATSANVELASATTEVSSEPLPSVTVGSTLMLDGQVFGDVQGSARLRVGGLTLKVEVLEWTGSSAKVRLPQLDLAGAATAEIEVLRADGSLASKTAIELTPAADRLALQN